MKTTKFIAAAIAAAGLFSTGALAQTPAAPASPNEVVYVPQLPSAAELTKAAAAQNITIERIDQTSSQIVVTYKYPTGQENTVAYEPLSSASGVAAPASSTTAAPASSTTTVVYSAPYYTYPYYPYYWGWYPPVAVGIGFGFHGGGWGWRR